MKLIHLSDLHLGKRVNNFPMLEDQAYILERVLEITDAECRLLRGGLRPWVCPHGSAPAAAVSFLLSIGQISFFAFPIA